MDRAMTRGEWKVGIDFNPSADPLVLELKTKAAAFIDALDKIQPRDGSLHLDSEVARLKSLAATKAEDAAMWAVKAATKQPIGAV